MYLEGFMNMVCMLCMTWVWFWDVWEVWFVFEQIGIIGKNVDGNVLYCFKLWRLTLEIGNFMSSHSLSAGHVPLGLGRDKVGIRALAQFMHF